MKILLAGPGTGKTTKIKRIIASDYSEAKKIQVLSFTNATIKDLLKDFADDKRVSCSTLHSFAFMMNHLPNLHVLDNKPEKETLEYFAKKLDIDFATICEYLQCITYEAMIASCVSFIKANKAYAKDKIGELDLFLVDEFQDFNSDEQKLIMLISEIASETIILGDDDQSIYGFKDAAPDGIISLYQNEKIEKIEHDNICYRCPDEIVDYCSKLLQKNKKRIPKEWKKSNKDGSLSIEQLSTQIDCDNYILSIIKSIRELDKQGSILILSSIGFVVNDLKKLMDEKGQDYVDCWSKKWDMDTLCKIWWLNVIYGKIKLPFLLFLLKYYGKHNNKRLINLLSESFHIGFKESVIIREIFKFDILPKEFTTLVVSPISIKEFMQKYSEFSYIVEYIDESDVERSVINLTNEIRVNNEFEKGKINLMSIHKSKGLQAEYVIINGLVQGILPNETFGIDTIEAQRRLLFVGMTRAMKELYLVSTVEWSGSDLKSNKADMGQFKYIHWKKKYNGKTSKFIEEIQ